LTPYVPEKSLEHHSVAITIHKVRELPNGWADLVSDRRFAQPPKIQE
jgi:hypothetical protein